MLSYSMEAPSQIKYTGQIRVGRIVYKDGKPIHPSYPGFKNIVIMTPSSAYGDLGPYVLRNKKGYLMENIYQSCKVYPEVPKSKQPYSRYDSRVIFDWPAERHVDVNEEGELQDIPNKKYWKWRKAIRKCPDAIRYPVGNNAYRKTCLYCLKKKGGKKLNIVEARKQIYGPLYTRLVKKQPKYQKLINMLDKGEKLLLIEVDAAHQESLPYYKEKYDVPENWIENHTILVTEQNMRIMIEDTTHSAGHGFFLGMSLMNITIT